MADGEEERQQSRKHAKRKSGERTSSRGGEIDKWHISTSSSVGKRQTKLTPAWEPGWCWGTARRLEKAQIKSVTGSASCGRALRVEIVNAPMMQIVAQKAVTVPVSTA